MSLKSQVVQGIKWRGIVDISQQVLQIGFTIILARLLSKADFGLVAMALLVNRFVVSVTNIGFGSAIIQSQSVNRGQVSAIFYIQFCLNATLSTVVYCGSQLAANFFDEPSLAPIIEAISIIIFLQTFQFPNILLRKRMDFKSFSIAEMTAMLSANICAIILAFLGYGVWSLVWRLLIQNIVFGLLSFSMGKWLPTKPNFQGIKPLFNFGLNMMGSKMIFYFSDNIVAILTGKLLGKEVLGLFNIAYNLAIKPSTKIQSILTSVLAPALPKIHFDKIKFRKNALNILQTTAFFFVPVMAMLAATSANLISTFYGDKWLDAGNMLLALSLVGLLRGLSHLMRNVVVASGNSRAILNEKLIEITFSLPAMYFLMPSLGIYGLIAGYFLGAFSGWIYLSKRYDESTGLQLGAIKAITSSVLKALGLFIIVYSINLLNLKHSITLIIQLATGTIVFASMLWFFDREELMAVIKKLKKKKKQSNQLT